MGVVMVSLLLEGTSCGAGAKFSTNLKVQAVRRTGKSSGMPTVAEQLRVAREARNLSINEVAEITKIRTDHIRALEEGNFDVFVAPVYIRGFARTYATLLKLDVPVLIKALDAELGQTEKFSEPPPLTDNKKGVVDFMTLQLSKLNLHRREILIGLSVLAVILVGILIAQRRRTADPSANLPPARVQTPSRDSGNTLPLPTPTPRQR
jgi:cytoskeleton protein RodZ